MYDKASIALIPSGTKTGKLYSVLPANGNGDFIFERGTTATRVNKDGLIESVTSDVPRLDYPLTNGVVGDCPHLLLEPSRTNDIQRTEEFDNAYWGKSNGTATANQTISPDGSQNADRFTENTSTASHFISRSGISIASSVSHTLSVFAKANGRNTFRLFEDDGLSAYAFFNLNSGSVGTTLNATAKMVNYGNGWYRCSITFTSTSTSTYIQFLLAQDNETTSYTGDGSSGMYFWGAQLEEGSYATSYIPTSGSTETRLADSCYNSGTSAEFNDSEGVLFAEIQGLVENSPARVISIGEGLNFENGIIMSFDTSNNLIKYKVRSNNITTVDISKGGVDRTLNHKIAITYKVNDFQIWLDGSKVASTTSGAVPLSLSKIQFSDMNVTGSPFYGKVKQLIYFNEALSDSELQTLTS